MYCKDYFDDKQLYAVLIVEYGGLDLEHAKLKNWAQAWSVLAQVGWSTAQAEQVYAFSTNWFLFIALFN